VACALVACAQEWTAQALELAAGPGATTQGDGVIHPSVHGWMGTSVGLYSSVSLSGQKNSVFSQQLATARLGYSAPLPKSKTIFAQVGLGGVFQRTLIFEQNESMSQLSKWSRAAGLALGVHWTLKPGKNVFMQLGWDALFIPPGESTIYLTFGHIQSVYSGLGWNF
jgi:opacity protein-like surface antigen